MVPLKPSVIGLVVLSLASRAYAVGSGSVAVGGVNNDVIGNSAVIAGGINRTGSSTEGAVLAEE